MPLLLALEPPPIALAEVLIAGPLACAIAVLVVAGGRLIGLPASTCGGLGLALGYVAGQVGLEAYNVGLAAALQTHLAPRDARQWLPAFVLLAAAATIVAARSPAAWRWVPLALMATLAAALPARLLAGSVYVTRTWSLPLEIVWLAGLAAAIAAVWMALSGTHSASAPVSFPWLRPVLECVVVSGTAIVLMMSSSLTYGKLGGAAAAALVGAAAAMFVAFRGHGHRPLDAALSEGTGGVLAVLIGGLLLLGYFFAELAALNAVLLVAALIAAGGPLPTGVTQQPRQHALLRSVLCLVPLVTAAALAAVALSARLREASEYGY